MTHSDGYPGWSPDPESHLLAVTIEAYEKLFGNKPLVRSIPCRARVRAFPEEIPLARNGIVRSDASRRSLADERLEVASVDKFWKLLTETLKMLE